MWGENAEIPLRREKYYVSMVSLVTEMVKTMLQPQTLEILLVVGRHFRDWTKTQLSEVRPSMFRQFIPCSTEVFASLFLIQTECFIQVRNIEGRRRLYLVTTKGVDIVTMPMLEPRHYILVVFQRYVVIRTTSPQRHILFSRGSSFFCFCKNVTPSCLVGLSPTSESDLGRLCQILSLSGTSLPWALALKTCEFGHGHLRLRHGTRIARWAMGLAVGLKHICWNMCWTYASRLHIS